MRPSILILLLPAMLACTGADEAHEGDTPAAAERPELTPAEVAGRWTGVSRGEEGDSILLRWTAVHVTDTSGYLSAAGYRDSIPFRVRFDGDSMMTTSEPYPAGDGAGAPQLMYRTVGRVRDGKLVGTVENVLASNPDSVVSRGRWEAARAAQ